MAGGWSRDGAVQDQIDASLKDALELARSRIPPVGEGLAHCEECDVAIPIARREAILGVRLCVNCQSGRDKNQTVSAGYNRRGSKGSQMK